MICRNLISKMIINILTIRGYKAVHDMNKHSKNAGSYNKKLLFRILKDNRNTEYGKHYGFADIHSVEDYQEKVPLTSFEDYAPYIDRMIKNGEDNLITAYPVLQYAETSGSIGVQKMIPVTGRSIAMYVKYTFSRICGCAHRYYKNVSNRHLPFGKALSFLEIEPTFAEDGKPRGSVSGAVVRNKTKVLPYIFTSPLPVIFPEGSMNMQYLKMRFAMEDPDTAYIVSSFMTNISDGFAFMKSNWQMIVEDIAKGTIHESMIGDPDVRKKLQPYLKPNPDRAEELRRIFEAGFDHPVAPKIWPKLAFVAGIGTGTFVPYKEKVQTFIGETPIDYFLYTASEGIFAATVTLNDPKYNLLVDSCFYEFLPTDGNADEKHPLLIDQLEVGKEYELIITNQSGFYRYRMHDVIRVVGHDGTTPQVVFSYRAGQLANLAAEKMTEEHLNWTMKAFGKHYGCLFTDYTLYIDYNDSPACYVLMIEADAGLDDSKGDEYATIFEEKLCAANPTYASCRFDRSIGHPKVRFLKPGTYARWRDYKISQGASSNQVKPVRILDTPEKRAFFSDAMTDANLKNTI